MTSAMTWKARLSNAGAAVSAAYGAVHVWWAVDEPPTFAVYPHESYFHADWLPVGLAVSATAACVLIGRGRDRTGPGRWAVAVLGLLSGAGLGAYSFLFALNLAGLLLGFGTDWLGLAARGFGVAAGVLTVIAGLGELRRARGACEHCGRVHGRPSERRTDPATRWAFVAAYVAMAGCLSRFTAQAITGFPGQDEQALFTPLVNRFTVFAVLMLIAGTLLPLALVHRWGRVWPRWVVPFAGRDVPRWLVLVPAFFMGAGLTGYFGLAGIPATIGQGFGEYPAWWSFAVIGGYTVWGIGLLVAATSYFTLTRPSCSGESLRGLGGDDPWRRLRPGGRPGLQHR